MKTIQQVRGVRRADEQEKKRTAPRGGTRAGQALHTAVRKNYVGTPKILKRKVSAKFF